jgi:hypothetical protein
MSLRRRPPTRSAFQEGHDTDIATSMLRALEASLSAFEKHHHYIPIGKRRSADDQPGPPLPQNRSDDDGAPTGGVAKEEKISAVAREPWLHCLMVANTMTPH